MFFRSKKGFLITAIVLVIGILLIVFLGNNDTLKDETKRGNNQDASNDANQGVSEIPFKHNLDEVSTSYLASVNVDPADKEVVGTLKVLAKNDTGKDQDKIYFHLYPNTFKDMDKLTDEVWQSVLGRNPKPGWIDIKNVHVNGEQTEVVINESIMEVPLSGWDNDKEVEIQIDFNVQVPKNNLRFSYDDNIMWLGNWLPIRAVFDEEGWNLDPYHAMGDPFYSDIANYQLAVTVPKDYQLASSGIEGNDVSISEDGSKQYVITINKVRDFAMTIMNESYEMMSNKVNNTEVRTWYLDTDNLTTVKQLHESAYKSIAYFSEKFGMYPYAEYDVVRTGGFFGGMEYPGLVYIEGTLFERKDPGGISTVIHETAHQWWYGIVGNDEVEEPWLDESLTHYSTLQFLMAEYPKIGEIQLEVRESGTNATGGFEEKGEYVGSPVTKFSDWQSYGRLVYAKGSQMFYHLERAIGTEKMNEALSVYFDRYKYKNASGEDLISVFEEIVSPNVRDYFTAWLQGGTARYEN